MGEPLRLRPWEIDQLTDREIHDLYCWPRDEQGGLRQPDADLGGPPEDMTEEQGYQVLRSIAMALGASEEEADRQIAAKRERQRQARAAGQQEKPA